MQSIDIPSRVRRVWENICKKVKNAIVFIDNPDQLHWAAGTIMMFQAGALNIKAFSAFESFDKSIRKAVFITNHALCGDENITKTVLEDLVKMGSFDHVTVFTDLSPEAHALLEFESLDEAPRVFQHFEDMVLDWMPNPNATVEFIYQPYQCTVITPSLFVLGNVHPLLPTEVEHLKKLHQREAHGTENFEISIHHLPQPAREIYMRFAYNLNSFFEMLNLNEDCYALGPTSKIVASELASLSWAKSRRKAAQGKTSVLLVDRTLDLASAVGHHSETLLDKIATTLPKFPNSEDVAIDMEPLFHKQNSNAKKPKLANNGEGDYAVLPGCLANPYDHEACELLHYISTARQKEGLMEVNRRLVEAASSSGLPLKLTGKPGRVTAESLTNTFNLYRNNLRAIKAHSGILQISKAVIDTLQSSQLQHNDSLLGVEKGLLQSLGDEDAPSVIKQLTFTIERELEKPPEERRYSLEDLFILLVYIYSLLWEKDIENHHERNLKASLSGAILETKKEDWPEFLVQLVKPNISEGSVSRAIDKVFQRLRGFSCARNNLRKYKFPYDKGGITSVASLKPIIQQVTEDIFNPSKPELVDVSYKSTGLRDLLKSGFGLFMNMSKPRPNDHPLLIIMVIGGVTFHEARLIKESVTAAKSNIQVVVGGTTFMQSPGELLKQLFVYDWTIRPEKADYGVSDSDEEEFAEADS